MIAALSKAGLGADVTLETLIRLASENGFQAIDVDSRELRAFVNEKGLSQAQKLLQEQGVKITSFGLPVQWRTTDDEFNEGVNDLHGIAELLRSFECTICYTYILPSTDGEIFEWMYKSTKRIRVCAQILNEYGIRLGLEFVGPHHLRTRWKNPLIWTIEDTLKWMELINESNVGLLLDSFHWHTTGGGQRELEALHASQIVHVHVNDARDLPVEEVQDDDRLFPGEGVINFELFIGSLRKIGYNGPVALEVLTPNPPKESGEVLAGKARDSFERIFKLS